MGEDGPGTHRRHRVDHHPRDAERGLALALCRGHRRLGGRARTHDPALRSPDHLRACDGCLHPAALSGRHPSHEPDRRTQGGSEARGHDLFRAARGRLGLFSGLDPLLWQPALERVRQWRLAPVGEGPAPKA